MSRCRIKEFVKGYFWEILAITLFAQCMLAQGELAESNEKPKKAGKLLPIFQVIKFPNTACDGDSRNGTCYSTEECEARGGTGSGTCAEGYGVCCIFSISCGETSSDNNTYLVQGATSSPTTNPCSYKICRCATNICRIKFDFTTFEIASPSTGTIAVSKTTTGTGGAAGDCTSDTFAVSSPSGVGTPVICGFNTGQHIFIDASEECHTATFNYGASTGTTRQYDIRITQYECNDELGGPQGCLQYFTSTTGTVASFNFPTTSTSIGSTATHLSNQCYTMCFRRASGMCAICFVPSITITILANNLITAQSSFGLSISANADIAQGQINENCGADYLVIPNGVTAANVATTPAINGIERVCGRAFVMTNGNTVTSVVSICTRTQPFQIQFKTDDNEVTTATANAINNELDNVPGGNTGFSLNFVQQSC